jgi:hypothetical protein
MAAFSRAWVFGCRRLIVGAVVMVALSGPGAAAASEGNLHYRGGPVLHSSAPFLVFWTPAGESIPARSRSLMARYFTDVAAASGRSSNVFGVLRQYHDQTGFADYRQTFDSARQVIIDRQAYPSSLGAGCPEPSVLYPTCIGDAQIQAEVQRLVTVDGLRTDGSLKAASFPPARLAVHAPIYFVVLPADVQVCQPVGGLCTGDHICAYHSNFTDKRGDVVLYAPVPLEPLRAGSVLFPDPKGDCQLDGLSVVQAPNGDVADAPINGMSHEDSEAITDPLPYTGWSDPKNSTEVGDKCEMNTSAKLGSGFGNNPLAFRPTLGGSEAAGTLYTQLINGDRYYVQSEWSNGDHNCAMRPTGGKISLAFTVSRQSRTTLSFDPSSSTSQETPSSATWAFGDGSQTKFRFGAATLSQVKHSYKRAGGYPVTLTLVDNRGNLKTITHKVTIK